MALHSYVCWYVCMDRPMMNYRMSFSFLYMSSCIHWCGFDRSYSWCIDLTENDWLWTFIYCGPLMNFYVEYHFVLLYWHVIFYMNIWAMFLSWAMFNSANAMISFFIVDPKPEQRTGNGTTLVGNNPNLYKVKVVIYSLYTFDI